jgi:hydrogenase expression/formation protein HypE
VSPGGHAPHGAAALRTEDAGEPRADGLLGACPVPRAGYEHIVLGHGSGGRLSAELLERVFLPAFDNPVLAALEDQATLPLALPAGGRLALTTDAFVVRPIFFPGGDIGRLAVCGTINDLVAGGARPLYLTAAFVLEEGLPIVDLERIVRSMRAACDEAGVTVVAGDTKVVDRGKGDRIFIATTGVGCVPAGRSLSVAAARPGDRLIVSGTLGDHGVAILALREGIELETALESDVAPLGGLVEAICAAAPDGLRGMRDPTRGGLASALNEMAAASGVGLALDERALPVRREVRAACELLGLDPLYVANEGKLVAAVAPERADAVLAAMRAHPLGREAACVGEVVAAHPGKVVLRPRVGGARVVPLLQGEQLPRIC